VGLQALRRAIRNFPLVAIGGITRANASKVIRAGADSVAVVSTLLSDPAKITDSTRILLQDLHDFQD
jgi:thiamine monophosphate synthase